MRWPAGPMQRGTYYSLLRLAMQGTDDPADIVEAFGERVRAELRRLEERCAADERGGKVKL